MTLDVSGPSDSTALQVTVDGAAVASETARLPRKLDPGRHVIVVSAAGFAPMTLNVEVEESDDCHLAVALNPATAASGGDARVGPAPALPEKSNAAALALPIWIAFGVGGAGLVVGSIAGVMGFASAGSAKSHCTGSARHAGRTGSD